MGDHGSYPVKTRCEVRDESDLSPDLLGHEGWRVEVRDVTTTGEAEYTTRRFYVGRSTGWRPCHLEVYNRRSTGGSPAQKHYSSVRRLYKR
jgi:hypothetical protein